MRAIIPALSRNAHTLGRVADRVRDAGLDPLIVFQHDTDAAGTPEQVRERFGDVELILLARPVGKGAAIKTGLAFVPVEAQFMVVDADLGSLNVGAVAAAATDAEHGAHSRLTYDTTGRVGSVIGDALTAVGIPWPDHLGGGWLSSNVLAYPAGCRGVLQTMPDTYGWNTCSGLALWNLGLSCVARPAGPRENHPTNGAHVRRILLDNLTAAMERSARWSG